MTALNRVGCLALILWALSASPGAAEPSRVIVGLGEDGTPVNPPADWPSEAGAWNGKAARYNEVTDSLVFESFRKDILGASRLRTELDPEGKGQASHKFSALVFEAGDAPLGAHEIEGTAVLYIASADGSDPRCIGCRTVIDGIDGVEIWKVLPTSDAKPNRPVRLRGAKIFANQNKDLAAWHPDGRWLTASVELPVHAGNHHIGAGEIGMFNDIYAISVDGKIWVQLTDWRESWTYADPVSPMPYQVDDPACPTGNQYGSAARPEPYAGYSCSVTGAPPPTNGVMRATLARALLPNGNVPLAWASRVGLDLRYSWGGVQHLATAELTFTDEGLPAIVNMRNNLAPTPENPDGEGLWANPDGDTLIGAGFEPWDFSFDGTRLAIATDAFLSHKPGINIDALPVVEGHVVSQIFVDVAERSVDGRTLTNLTAFHPDGYAYPDSASAPPLHKFGYFEEPTAYVELGPEAYVAISSSASAAFDIASYHQTFILETWLFGAKEPRPARPLTNFNAQKLTWTYPTNFNRKAGWLYLTQVPGGLGGGNPPGVIRVMELGTK